MPYNIVVSPPNDPDVLKGLAQGIYKITGGVIREVASGKIVVHMREVGDIPARDIASSLGPIAPYASVGVGVLTLATVALSTYYLSRQISKLSEKLDKLFQELQKVRQDIELIKAIEVFKDLRAALFLSEDMIRDEKLRWELMTERLKTFGKAVAVYDIYIDYAFTKLFTGSNPEVVIEPLKLYMLAYAGYSELLLEFDEVDQSAFEYQRAYDRVRDIYKQLVDSTVPTHEELNKLEFLKVDIERFWGYKKEVETVKNLNIPFSEWKGLTKGKDSGIYLIKPPVFESEQDKVKL